MGKKKDTDEPKAREAAPVRAPAKQEQTRTPDEWTKAMHKPSPRGRQHPDKFLHAAAAQLHGWIDHAHHEGKAMQLTRAQYEGALRASGTPGPRGSYIPHPGACSAHALSKKKGR